MGRLRIGLPNPIEFDGREPVQGFSQIGLEAGNLFGLRDDNPVQLFVLMLEVRDICLQAIQAL